MVIYGSDVSRDEISSFLVELYPREERTRGSGEIFEEIRQRTKILPGVYVGAMEMETGPPTGKDIQIQISSSDRQAMYRATAEISPVGWRQRRGCQRFAGYIAPGRYSVGNRSRS